MSQAALWAGFVVFLRIGSMIAMIPLFGEQSVPSRIRLGLAIAFTFVIFPIVEPSIFVPPTNFIAAIFRLGPEILTGLFFGMVLRFFIFSLQIAGSIAAQSTSLSQIFGGSAGTDAQPVIGHILVTAGLALAALTGLHVKVVSYMIASYDIVPPGVLINASVIGQLGVDEVTRTFSLGFTLAAPFVIASLVYNVTLGVINRAMPQLMVSFVGAPAITAGGLLMLFIAAPVMLTIWLVAFDGFMADPFGGYP